MNPDYTLDLIDYIKDKDFSINVISKSGTTTEPAIAFELLKKLLIDKYGKDGANERIYVTTDKEVKVAGWIENIRDHGGVSFVDLRDMYGVLQVVMRNTDLLKGLQ